MPAWNPSSSVNTIDGAYRLGRGDVRRLIADRLEALYRAEPDITPVEVLKRIRSGELDVE